MSICIPSYNAGKYIEETIDSILNQDYPNIEIIIVDDGSTDETQFVIGKNKDPRIKSFFQENKGAAAARNNAFRKSRGTYIKFMDADDLLNPACISFQINKIIHHPGCIASAKWGRFYLADQSDFTLSPEKVWKDLPGIDWLVNSLIDTGANMMQPGIFLLPRQIVETAGPWNESLSLIDDFEYMVRVISNSKIVLFCEDAILMYRSGLQNSLSGKNSAIHMASAFQSLKLGVDQLLRKRNDFITRQACANTYQRWSYQFYPQYKIMYEELQQEITRLGGSNTPIIGGKTFNMMSKLMGWKNAKKLKMLLAMLL